MISDWKQLPNAVRLEAGEVHVWLAALEADQTSRSLLSSDEQERAERFRFEKDQVQYTAGRAFLRTILSRYLQVPPQELRQAVFGGRICLQQTAVQPRAFAWAGALCCCFGDRSRCGYRAHPS